MKNFCLTLILISLTLHVFAGADHDWQRVEEMRNKGNFLQAQKLYAQFARKYPEDDRAAEAKRRTKKTCFLRHIPVRVTGPDENRINLVISGDGYTIANSDQKKFLAECKKVHEYFLTQVPLKDYEAFFNVSYLQMASDSDVLPKSEISEAARTSAFKSSYHLYQDLPKCSVPLDYTQHVLDHYAPNWDTSLIVVKRGEGGWGWRGGDVNAFGANEFVVAYHEFGHSFGNLWDEYGSAFQGGGSRYNGPPIKGAINLSTDKDSISWKDWLEVRGAGIGVFEGGAGFDRDVWHPGESCLMGRTASASQFCAVCREAMVLAMYRFVKLIDPIAKEERNIDMGNEKSITIEAQGPPLNKKFASIKWMLDGEDIRGKFSPGKDSNSYTTKLKAKKVKPEGSVLKLVVEDQNPMVLPSKWKQSRSVVKWKIQKSVSE